LNYADDFQIPDNAFLGVWDVFAVQPIQETLEAGHILLWRHKSIWKIFSKNCVSIKNELFFCLYSKSI